ncbi:MAG: septal ring lytic transglycosylase RlpA family protein [Methylobacterium sp.]|uniref:septal ring lytic transglycosylase RlpA family protein n=1 Tax=Methylobacterium sp. TaxID=409 RepID=UPI0025F216A5|nr:septal ring lytic transglycosylase RlpA family protein [Methylobacterium sp.]MBX9933335.1 septal ring lytic transglycosylase RlpA family protein [Methylobacterium sp.]
MNVKTVLVAISLAASTCLVTTCAHAETAARGQAGMASWYGPGFHGKRTANGERFNTHSLTAAHRTLPFGSRVRVTNKTTGRSIVVRINDRGPFVGGRVIDLSKASARAIGVAGVARVVVARL